MTSALLRTLAISLLILARTSATGSTAGGPRALPEGKLPDDLRLSPLKDLDGYFPFVPPASPAAWSARADEVRRRILVSQGLWPMPTRTPLNAVIHGRVDQGEYTVEKVFFESAPGFFVTGNLYRPTGRTGKLPGILFAHGHWTNARLSESTDAELLREIATGEERFENGGHSRFQSLCVQMARMGCVVWQWDMLGNSDALQLSMELVHGFRAQRPEMNSPENWGLFSPQAEAHLQSAMGLQTWNSIRSLDFLLSLPEVDAERIAITGASGGGTQTMLLAAIDPRVKLSFPAVMVSTAMQGGCTCENACLLRVDTGNVEFAALFAPGPQGMTTANDWTKEMATKGFPQLRQLYGLLGATDNVMLHRGEHFPHNYNAVSRSAFYGWVNRHFHLGFKEPVIERDYPVLHGEQLTVWDAKHPTPAPDDPDFERRLLRGFHEDSQKQLAAAAQNPDQFRKILSALETIIGRTLDQVGTVEWELVHKTDRNSWVEMTGLLKNPGHHEELPVAFCYPKKWNGTTVIWLDDQGKSGLFKASGAPLEEVQRLIDSGMTVMGADLLYEGEFLQDDKPLTKTPRVKNPREAAAYSFGYNHTVFAQRVHDILSLVKFVQTQDRQTEKLHLVGLGETGPCVAAARPLLASALHSVFVQSDGFRFSNLTDFHHPAFLPGGAKYGDLPAILSLGSSDLMVWGETSEALVPFKSVAVKPPQIAAAGHPVRETAANWLLSDSPR